MVAYQMKTESERVQKLTDYLLSFYNPELPFGFRDINLSKEGERIGLDKIGLLEGASGVLLTLLAVTTGECEWNLPFMLGTYD